MWMMEMTVWDFIFYFGGGVTVVIAASASETLFNQVSVYSYRFFLTYREQCYYSHCLSENGRLQRLSHTDTHTHTAITTITTTLLNS